ncbi:MAG: peptide chain release factor N(5)-glutamine methyltransferase [Candidatus Babeliales bacterium]|nr:peptide chain release factor N(5)-glutamine methyltransferase [Candidatus Babeliales bacterium]
MKIQKLIDQIAEELQSTEHAWWLLEVITNKTKFQLLFESSELTDQQLTKLNYWVYKITQEHYPIQYLIASVPFLDCEILVEPPILIPRPETEEWCADLIEQLKTLENKNITILDMCTGSGCIAISVAASLPQAQVFAVDISDKAIALTKKNIELNKVSNVIFVKSDLYKELGNNKFDLIVTNPPYIDEALFETLDLSVKNWEDPNALISKDGGLFLIKQIIKKAPKYLKNNLEFQKNNIPNLVIEIDETQGEKVAKLMQETEFINVQIKKDLYGKNRVVCGNLSVI